MHKEGRDLYSASVNALVFGELLFRVGIEENVELLRFLIFGGTVLFAYS